MDKAFLIIVLCLALAGCGINRTLYVPGSLPCNLFSEDGKSGFELDPGAKDRLTRGEKEQVVSVNEAGEQICGWEAP